SPPRNSRSPKRVSEASRLSNEVIGVASISMREMPAAEGGGSAKEKEPRTASAPKNRLATSARKRGALKLRVSGRAASTSQRCHAPRTVRQAFLSLHRQALQHRQWLPPGDSSASRHGRCRWQSVRPEIASRSPRSPSADGARGNFPD